MKKIKKRQNLLKLFFWYVNISKSNMRVWWNWQTRKILDLVGYRAGSSPVTRTIISGCGAVGSALDWGARGRKFKSCHSDQKGYFSVALLFLFYVYVASRLCVCFFVTPISDHIMFFLYQAFLVL